MVLWHHHQNKEAHGGSGTGGVGGATWGMKGGGGTGPEEGEGTVWRCLYKDEDGSFRVSFKFLKDVFVNT